MNSDESCPGRASRVWRITWDNHLEGVHDTGHGCGKPLGMTRNIGGSAASGRMGEAASGLIGALAGATGQGGGGCFGIEKLTEGAMGRGGDASGVDKFAEEAVGGDALGRLVGPLANGMSGGLLSGVFGGHEERETRSFASEGRTQEGGYQKSYTEFGRSGNQYAQAQYSETQILGGGRETDYKRFQQRGEYGSGFEQRTEARPTYGGGFEQQTTEKVYRRPNEVETDMIRGSYRRWSPLPRVPTRVPQ